ncbi:hypothetical protein [Methylobacterium sp. 37f]|uniref:hypothetical protein n=1 Tax=Methylobacterium sp. 37f TaxID=2817058 RepID=UPI001FFC5B18|nr:hypothetical protein [Methylobacterium sp. 37f]MCK2056993.1 hypothetical protein [Methylobacterium sp. 37f]
MNSDHPQVAGDRVSFVAHGALIDALDKTAAEIGVSRANIARVLIAQALREAGRLAPQAPASRYEARHRART